MAWRVANSLITLRDQLNALHPNRSKASDGFIGDTAHQSQGSASDHNPWVLDGNGIGVVTAFDITHDPANGVDIDQLSDTLAASRDPRIKYVIANRLIMVPADSGWSWQPYEGDDPHTNHLHLSVNTTNYDDAAQWKLNGGRDMVQDTQWDYDVLAQTFKNFTGRKLSRDEFKSQVGRSWQDVLVTFQGSPETDTFYKKATAAVSDAAKKLDQIKAIVNQ